MHCLLCMICMLTGASTLILKLVQNPHNTQFNLSVCTQLFGPDRLLQKEDVAVTKAMQDMAYHSKMMPPVRPIWLDDTSFWLLGPDNAVRRGVTATIEGRAYQVRSAGELPLTHVLRPLPTSLPVVYCAACTSVQLFHACLHAVEWQIYTSA